jgi:hypothetical protein
MTSTRALFAIFLLAVLSVGLLAQQSTSMSSSVNVVSVGYAFTVDSVAAATPQVSVQVAGTAACSGQAIQATLRLEAWVNGAWKAPAVPEWRGVNFTPTDVKLVGDELVRVTLTEGPVFYRLTVTNLTEFAGSCIPDGKHFQKVLYFGGDYGLVGFPPELKDFWELISGQVDWISPVDPALQGQFVARFGAVRAVYGPNYELTFWQKAGGQWLSYTTTAKRGAGYGCDSWVTATIPHNAGINAARPLFLTVTNRQTGVSHTSQVTSPLQPPMPLPQCEVGDSAKIESEVTFDQVEMHFSHLVKRIPVARH